MDCTGTLLYYQCKQWTQQDHNSIITVSNGLKLITNVLSLYATNSAGSQLYYHCKQWTQMYHNCTITVSNKLCSNTTVIPQ